MNCPKCGKENPEKFCNYCNTPFTPSPFVSKKVNIRIRTSKIAIASLVCAFITLGCFIPGLIAILDPRALNPESETVNSIACISVLIGGITFILGIIALSTIGASGGRVTGKGFAAIGTALPLILILILFCFNIGGWFATNSPGLICGTNLSGIGKAMLIYSNDYNDEFPRAGGVNGQWVARTPWWAADNRNDAYGLSDPNGIDGRASISASLYLLVKYAEVTPKSFVCREDYGTTKFNPADYGITNRYSLLDIWDFGPNPPKHCSYSYHMPYGQFALSISSEPGMAVAADRNPWQDSPFAQARDFQTFNPIGDKETTRAGNTIPHRGDGQNVLFMDCHVGFEKQSFCGINDDNIYTYWDGQNIRRGIAPALGSQPVHRLDSMLVNDPAIPHSGIFKKKGF
jgi:hypothetical protein